MTTSSQQAVQDSKKHYHAFRVTDSKPQVKRFVELSHVDGTGKEMSLAEHAQTLAELAAALQDSTITYSVVNNYKEYADLSVEVVGWSDELTNEEKALFSMLTW